MNVTFSSDSNTSATLNINLHPYIAAYHALKANQITSQAYSVKHAELVNGLEQIHAEEIWKDLFKHATHHMDEATQKDILESPAYFFMRQQFVELLKNSIEALLTPHMGTQGHTNQGGDELHLTLTIDDVPQDEVTLTLSDNATGFPLGFLEKIGTRATRENTNYYQTRGSDKHGQKDGLLIGGAGKGLKMLAALVDHGEKIAGPMDRKPFCTVPETSRLVFNNKAQPEHGAVISITTSKTPLVLHVQEQTEAPVMALSSSRFGRFKKQLPPLKQTAEPTQPKIRKNLEEARKSDEKFNPAGNATTPVRQSVKELQTSKENIPPSNQDDDNNPSP